MKKLILLSVLTLMTFAIFDQIFPESNLHKIPEKSNVKVQYEYLLYTPEKRDISDHNILSVLFYNKAGNLVSEKRYDPFYDALSIRNSDI